MDKKLFAERLKEQYERRFKTQTAFIVEYDKTYKPETFNSLANAPHKGTKGSIKKYVSPASTTIPGLDKVDNICNLLDSDIDYLLGYIDFPKHVHQAMNKECGLSQKATDNLMRWKKSPVAYSNALNALLENENFEQLLYFALRIMEVKPALDELRKTREKWLRKSCSGPPDCGSAYNYNGDNGTADAIKEKEMEYNSAKLQFNEYIILLMKDIEKQSQNHVASREG